MSQLTRLGTLGSLRELKELAARRVEAGAAPKHEPARFIIGTADGFVTARVTECADCGGSGYVSPMPDDEPTIIDGGEYHVCTVCGCNRMRKAARRITAARLPEKHSLSTLFESTYPGAVPYSVDIDDDLEAQQTRREAVTMARVFLERVKGGGTPGLTLIGKPGLGKTHILVGLAKALIHAGSSVRYIGWTRFAFDVNAASNAQGRYQLLDAAQAADVLILDELGAGVGDDRGFKGADEKSWLNSIICTRFDSGRPMLFGSNFGPADLAKRLGPHTYSRITGARCQVVMLKGRDQRQVMR